MEIKIPQIDDLKEKIEQVVEQVENPQKDQAKATFGYKLTEEEQKKRALWHEIIEKGWWALALLLVFIIMVWNWATIKGFYDFLINPKEPLVVAEPVLEGSSIIESIFSGRVREVSEDLQWLNKQFFLNVAYYEAGKVIEGDYLGASRYWVTGQLRADQTIRAYEFFVLADGRVLLNGGKPNPRLWLQIMQEYYLWQYFNTEKVKIIDELPSDFPHTLSLNPAMMLYRREVLTDLGPYDGSYYGHPKLGLVLDADDYLKLPSLEAQNYKDLTFYSKTYNSHELFSQVADNMPPALDGVLDKYVQAGTKIVVTDKTGVSMVYELVFKDQWENYLRTSLNRDLLSLDFYQQDLIKYIATSNFKTLKNKILAGEVITNFMDEPSVPTIEMGYPGFYFKTNYFEFGIDSPLFVKYVSGLTAICEPRIDGKVMKNIDMSELEEIGRVFVPQAPIYRLKEIEHSLHNLVYEIKILHSDLDEDSFVATNFDHFILMKNYDRYTIKDIEKGRKKLTLPTLQEYIEKMPVLFIHDPWGRLVMVWENEINFLKKCVTIPEEVL